MKTITCDICKRAVPQPSKNRNYFHIGDRDLCETCKERVELNLRPVIRTKQPFNYEWYNRVLQDSIEKAIQTGKLDTL
jgi:hypothetical protein